MSGTLEKTVAYKSPLYEMTQTTPTCLWNDSATLSELTYSIEHGAVGATCNPVIVLDALKKEAHLWNDRIRALAVQFPVATEEEAATTASARWSLSRITPTCELIIARRFFSASAGMAQLRASLLLCRRLALQGKAAASLLSTPGVVPSSCGEMSARNSCS